MGPLRRPDGQVRSHRRRAARRRRRSAHPRLWGHHGFTERIAHYERMPVEWDFPVTRVLNCGEPQFAHGADLDREFPLLSPARSLLNEVVDDAALVGATLVALPIFYAGVLTAVCTVVARHDRPWYWPDLTHLNGTCAAISLWQRIAELDRRETTFGFGRLPQASGRRDRSAASHHRTRPRGQEQRQHREGPGLLDRDHQGGDPVPADHALRANRTEMVERADLAGITRKSPTGT